MSIFVWIFVGLIAGWIAEQITGRDHGLLTNLFVGVLGALIGSFLVDTVLGFSYPRGFNLATLSVATLGSVLLLWLVGGRPKLLSRLR